MIPRYKIEELREKLGMPLYAWQRKALRMADNSNDPNAIDPALREYLIGEMATKPSINAQFEESEGMTEKPCLDTGMWDMVVDFAARDLVDESLDSGLRVRAATIIAANDELIALRTESRKFRTALEDIADFERRIPAYKAATWPHIESAGARMMIAVAIIRDYARAALRLPQEEGTGND